MSNSVELTIEDLEKVATSTVWNFHNVNIVNVAKRNGTNLNRALKELISDGFVGNVTLYVEAIGWSGHSSSRVGVYKGTLSSGAYSSRYGEVFLSDSGQIC